MKDFKKALAEQREEALAGVADGLRAGGTFKDVMRDAAAYGVKPEAVAAIRGQDADLELRKPEKGWQMTPERWAEKVADSIAARVECGYEQPDADGERRVFDQMTPQGQLANIAQDSAHWGVTFEAFVAAVTRMIAPDALLDAALRVAHSSQRELAAVEMAMPDDGGYGKVPLADRVSDLAAEARAERSAVRDHENEGIERVHHER
ncbi:hypothetical protein J8F10_09290 [Gemmata sp. G18]|uniref:Uncharacterized protein n=1 Tax=Gemmata palustris TaxID=2822762 RepID=A0ABS5BP71_9BACT|nr:hypothetical protein [Gemmata palustris]MBP3955474.1 hypothetical protein [Gemmata palustris]